MSIKISVQEYPELADSIEMFEEHERLVEKTKDDPLNDLITSLFNFDHTYEYSDCLSTWRSGNESKKILKEEIDSLDIDQSIKNHLHSGYSLNGRDNLIENFEYARVLENAYRYNRIKKYLALKRDKVEVANVGNALLTLLPVFEYLKEYNIKYAVPMTKAISRCRPSQITESYYPAVNLPDNLQRLVNRFVKDISLDMLERYIEVMSYGYHDSVLSQIHLAKCSGLFNVGSGLWLRSDMSILILIYKDL